MPARIFVLVAVLEDARAAVKDATMYVEDAQEVVMELVKELVQLAIISARVVVLLDAHEHVILVRRNALLDVKLAVRVFVLENA